MELQGNVALVTGAGSGIGKASAVRLAREGARVIVHAHKEEEARATVNAITKLGGAAFGITADLRDDQSFRSAIESGVEAFGSLDVVVANAGINGVWAPIDELKPEEWDNTIQTNLRGTYLRLR